MSWEDLKALAFSCAIVAVIFAGVEGAFRAYNVHEGRVFRDACLHDGHSAEDCVRIFPP